MGGSEGTSEGTSRSGQAGGAKSGMETALKAHDGQTAGAEAFSVREDRSAYGSPHPADMTDMVELRQRAIAAAGRFESGVPDISVERE